MNWVPLFVIGAPLIVAGAPFWAPAAFRFFYSRLTADGRVKREIESLVDIKVAMICALLRDGRGWTFGRYTACHRELGISVWIANKAYGLGASFDGHEARPESGKLTARQKRKIWRAYIERGEEAKSAADQLEQFMVRVRKYQDEAA